MIIKKSGDKLIEETPFEVQYEAEFGEPFTTVKLKFSNCPFVEIGEPLFVLNKNKIVWSGKVTQTGFLQKSLLTEYSLTARSGGFALRQSEARPAVYEKPTFGDICSFHVAPHGMDYEFDNACCDGVFSVTAGMTEWEAVESFCADVSGVRPYVDSSGAVRCGRVLPEGEVLFDDNILSVRLVRSGESAVKTVFYKPEKTQDYKFYLNSESERADIGAVRFENLSNLPPWQGQSRLNQILKNSLRNAEMLTVETSGFPKNCCIGSAARVKGINGVYRIESIFCRLNGTEKFCSFTLLPEEFYR